MNSVAASTDANDRNFDKKLFEILANLKLSNDDRESYINDANDIRAYMIRRMNAMNDDFKRYFHEATLFGSYLNEFDIDKPDEFDIHLKFKLPCNIRVSKGNHPPGSLNLFLEKLPNGSSYVNTPFSNRRRLCRQKLQNWLCEIFGSIFMNKQSINLRLHSGRIYKIDYSKHLSGYAVAHSLYAVDELDEKRKISLDFLPCFEFSRATWLSDRDYPESMEVEQTWFAVPYPKSRGKSFMICAPELERELLREPLNDSNLKNSLRLIKVIGKKNGMPRLRSNLFKNIYLWENQRHKNCDGFWNQPIGDLLIYITKCLLENFRTGYILFYWNMEANLLHRFEPTEVADYTRKLQEILGKLTSFRQGKSSFKDFREIFGV